MDSAAFLRDVPDPDPFDGAACRADGVDPDWFFPEAEDADAKYTRADLNRLRAEHYEKAARAKLICAGCPLAATCLLLGMDEEYGVFGGLTAKERERL